MLPLSTKIQPLESREDQIPLRYELAKASTALNRGEIVVRTSGASTVEAGAPTSTTSAKAAGILGVYNGGNRAASLADTPRVPVVVAQEGTQFVFPVEAGASTARQNGDIIGLESNDGVDLSDTTNKIVVFRGVYATNPTTGYPSHIRGEFYMG